MLNLFSHFRYDERRKLVSDFKDNVYKLKLYSAVFYCINQYSILTRFTCFKSGVGRKIICMKYIGNTIICSPKAPLVIVDSTGKYVSYPWEWIKKNMPGLFSIILKELCEVL